MKGIALNFKVGQMVELVDNRGMVAQLKATAIVYCVDDGLIHVRWKTNHNGQGNGGYYLHHFRPLVTKGQQLLFAFMGE